MVVHNFTDIDLRLTEEQEAELQRIMRSKEAKELGLWYNDNDEPDEEWFLIHCIEMGLGKKVVETAKLYHEYATYTVV